MCGKWELKQIFECVLVSLRKIEFWLRRIFVFCLISLLTVFHNSSATTKIKFREQCDNRIISETTTNKCRFWFSAIDRLSDRTHSTSVPNPTIKSFIRAYGTTIQYCVSASVYPSLNTPSRYSCYDIIRYCMPNQTPQFARIFVLLTMETDQMDQRTITKSRTIPR